MDLCILFRSAADPNIKPEPRLQPAPPSDSGRRGDHAAAAREGDASTPVRISRKDLRRMNTEELKLRKSAADRTEVLQGENYNDTSHPEIKAILFRNDWGLRQSDRIDVIYYSINQILRKIRPSQN